MGKEGGKEKNRVLSPLRPGSRSSSTSLMSTLHRLAPKQPRNPTSGEQNPPFGMKSPKTSCGKIPWREEGGRAGEAAAAALGIASCSP